MSARAHVLVLLWAWVGVACTSDREWVPPPSATAPTAIVSRIDRLRTDVFAFDGRLDSSLLLEDVAEETLVEAALFAESLEALGLEAGFVEPGTLARPLRPRDGSAFSRLILDIDEPQWISASALSSEFADFALPVERPEDPCPSFEQELVVLQEPGLVYFGALGADDRLIIGGRAITTVTGMGFEFGVPQLFEVARDGSSKAVANPAEHVIRTAVTKDGSGFWGAQDNLVYAGAVRARTLEIAPMGGALPQVIQMLAGSSTSSNGLLAMLSEEPGPEPKPPAVFRFDGQDWSFVADAPMGSDSSLAYADGEAVFVSNGLAEALHIRGAEVRRRVLPDIATFVGHAPGFGFIAGERGAFMRYVPADGRWEGFARPAAGTTRLRGITPFRDGFFAIYESAIAYYSPKLEAFCTPIDIPWSDLTWAEVIGGDVFVYPRSDLESNSLRLYLLRHQGGG